MYDCVWMVCSSVSHDVLDVPVLGRRLSEESSVQLSASAAAGLPEPDHMNERTIKKAKEKVARLQDAPDI